MNNPSPLACGLDLTSFKPSTITLVESPSKFVPDLLVADVGGYCIYVDQNGRFILHDCQDWQRGMCWQRLCKYVVALILSLLPEKGRVLLGMIKEQGWDFRSYTG